MENKNLLKDSKSISRTKCLLIDHKTTKFKGTNQNFFSSTEYPLDGENKFDEFF